MNTNDSLMVVASILSLGIITCCCMFIHNFYKNFSNKLKIKDNCYIVYMNNEESAAVKSKKDSVRKDACEAGKTVKF